MTTQIRMTKNTDLIRSSVDYSSLRSNSKSQIAIWELHYTGTSSNSETEIDAPNNEWDGDLEEVTSITCLTKENSIGSAYVTLYASDSDGGGAETAHYYYIDKAEITEVTCLAKADCTAESTFHFYVDDGAGGETHYYVWINKAGTDSDPNETGTAIEADISGSTTATDVAGVIATAIDAKANVGAANASEVVTITNANNGNVTDAGDGEGTATGFTFSIEQGGDDPSATGTGHSVDVSGDTSATDVASTMATAINGSTNLTASNSSEVITVECDNTGSVTDASQSGTAVSSISITRQGSDTYGSGTLYIKSTSSNDTDSDSGHARKVKVLGFDGSGNPISRDIALNGTSYVAVSNMKRVIHMYAWKFGSGGTDTAGNVTLETTNTGNGTTILTIAANGTESNGGRIYVPDGNYCGVINQRMANITNTNTGSTIVKVYLTGFDHYLNTDPDFEYYTGVCSQYGTVIDELQSLIPKTGSDSATITIKEREMGTSGNEEFVYTLKLITFQ